MSDTETNRSQIVIRAAEAADQAEIARVAGRDTSRAPVGPILVAEVGGEIRAALALADGEVVADPFHRTTELVEMLRIRARGIAEGPVGQVVSFRRSRRARLAFRSAA